MKFFEAQPQAKAKDLTSLDSLKKQALSVLSNPDSFTKTDISSDLRIKWICQVHAVKPDTYSMLELKHILEDILARSQNDGGILDYFKPEPAVYNEIKLVYDNLTTVSMPRP